MIQENYTQRGLRQSLDWKLVLCYLALVLIGWLNIYASVHSSEPASIFDFGVRSGKQFVWILTSFALALTILFVIPPSWWQGLSPWIYLGVVFLLGAVIFLGVEVKGSRSWFEFGPVRFQPAEVSKISTSLLLSMLLSRTGFRLSRPRDFFLAVAIIGLPMLIIRPCLYRFHLRPLQGGPLRLVAGPDRSGHSPFHNDADPKPIRFARHTRRPPYPLQRLPGRTEVLEMDNLRRTRRTGAVPPALAVGPCYGNCPGEG